jgi:hypothetical protein
MTSSPMTAPVLRPLVVTGCARSGTMYIAAVLGGLGLRVGHEVVFGPRTRRFDGWHGQHGDCSWLAAPFLGQIGDAVVRHQVRHPLAVVRSLVGMRFFADRGSAFLHGDDAYTRAKWQVRRRLVAAGHVEPSDHGPRPHKVYRGYIAAYAPELWEPVTEVERALRYWLAWTRLIKQAANPAAYSRHHLELLDPETLAELLTSVGLDVAPGHVALAMAKVPSDKNTGRIAGLDWDDLPAGPLRDQVAELADQLGYEPANPRTPPHARQS